MAYRVETTSVEGFVQQIACCYLRHGYWFYVTGSVPSNKDPKAVDEKLLAKYGIAVSESTRMRRKRQGVASLQLIRHGRFFAILATKGRHRFFDEEAERLRDIRKSPLRYAGYAISYRPGGRTRAGEIDPKWHSHVSIDRDCFLDVRAKLFGLALHRRADELARALYEMPFERYAPIRRQLLRLVCDVNKKRSVAGYALVPIEVLGLRRRVVKPFGCAESSEIA